MNAGWTFGHYPPSKFLLPGFPRGKAAEQIVIRDEQKERVVLGRDEDRYQLQSPTRGAVVLSSETG